MLVERPTTCWSYTRVGSSQRETPSACAKPKQIDQFGGKYGTGLGTRNGVMTALTSKRIRGSFLRYAFYKFSFTYLQGLQWTRNVI